MKDLLNREGNSKVVVIALWVCIILVLILIFSNIYYITLRDNPNPGTTETLHEVSNENNSFDATINFVSNVILCGSGENRYITSTVNSSGNSDLYGIKFIVTDNKGADHNYINDTREALPFGSSAKKIDTYYSQFNLESSLNITQVRAVLTFKDILGNNVFGSSTPQVNVCYSSCNDCTASCEIICP